LRLQAELDAQAEAEAIASRVRQSSLGEEVTKTESVGESLYRIGVNTYSLEGSEHILGNSATISDPEPIANIKGEVSRAIFFGDVFENSQKDNFKGDKTTVTLGVSDGSSSIYLKKAFNVGEAGPMASLKVGKTIAVVGKVYRDKFDGELVCNPHSIWSAKRILRTDNAEEKRVELHLHTTMSTMDALIRPDELIKTAKRWGHKAIAVTDHGNVQAFPEIAKVAKKEYPELKILYGMEAYYVDDTARALYGEKIPSFDDEMVVFDIETTGLSTVNCKITEIGAVKIKSGEVIDRFNTFVNPEVPIPEEIAELTHITDDMVKDAPKIKEALVAFYDFVGDSMLIAHNANFDTGFIRVFSEQCGLEFKNSYLDTVSLSRYLNPTLKKHKLDSLVEHYKLGSFNHHRACDDAEMLASIFFCMMKQLKEEGVYDFSQMMTMMSEKADPLSLRPHHLIIFAQNKVGLKNLYRLISESYLTYYRRRPRIPKSLISRHREGLIIGSACEQGELYQAILDGRAESDIDEMVSFYDYLEIQPLCNNRFLIAEGKVADEEMLKSINRRIIALGKKHGKPTVATCDAHFINKEDEIYRKILLAGMKFADADKDTGIYLRTTDEMLAEFSYLGDELAREVVIENTNKIADEIESIIPIPDGTYTPKMEGAEEDLQRMCWERAHDWYGETLPDIVKARLERELNSIIENGFAVLYMIAQKLVSFSEGEGYLVGSRGSVGSSFVATMAGISEVNPLPPHYRCPKCKHSEFDLPAEYGSGFDLPDKNCPHCNTLMYADGHNIPFETFLGFKGDKSPDIDLNFSGDVQGKVHKYTETLFGETHVFRAGTTGTLADKTAYGYVVKYLEERGITLPKAEVSRLIVNCAGVKRTTGQHPGGIIVVPKEYDVYDFTPVQHPAEDATSNIITTHFQFSYLHDTILKLDELGHDIPTKYKYLERYTDTSVLDVKMNDPAVYNLYLTCEPLGVTEEDIGSTLGTYGLPEFGTRFAIRMLEEAKPKSFADLLQISGLSHGTDVWTGNAQELIKEGICNISQVIGCRDNIMNDLIRYGLDKLLSFTIMESVRKGKGLKPEWVEEMKKNDVPDWYIDSCKKIKYMFPKAHAAAYVMSAIRLGWYKIYYPMQFYAAFLSAAPGGFDAEIVMRGRGYITDLLNDIDRRKKDKNETVTQKEEELYSTMLLVRESLARGVQYLPVDLYKSDAKAYLPENGKIRMPFSSLAGLGDTAAQKIVDARNAGEIFSIEDLRTKAGLSKTIIELLRSNGALDGLSETNQFTFF
ncbi:MAG: PolC-type DNA polymerase III, partial [Clostridia bacterium]|nr:PolC-type DNA polymerase III [Clostridia bacterium]